MHIKKITIRAYKRFTNFSIDNLPESTKLVVMAGPNGGGKSSLFDALLTWHGINGVPMRLRSHITTRWASPLIQVGQIRFTSNSMRPFRLIGMISVRSFMSGRGTAMSQTLRCQASPVSGAYLMGPVSQD